MSNKFSKKLIISIILLICVSIAVLTILSIRNKKDIVWEVGNVKYDATNEINEAMSKLDKDKQESKVLTNVNTLDKVVSITFLGLSDMDTNNKVADIMAKYNKKATFMVPGILAAEDSNFIKKLNEAGHRIGSNGLSGSRHLEKLTREQVVKEFARTNNIIRNITNEAPTLLQATSTVYTNELLEASYACGYDYVVNSRNFINYQSFTSYEQVLNYVKDLEKGSILTVKMNGVLDEMEYIKETEEIKDQDESKNQINEEVVLGTNEERLVQIVEWIVKALDETNYETVYVEELPYYEVVDDNYIKQLRMNNNGKLAEEVNTVYTTNQALTFTFYGVNNTEVLYDVLGKLDSIHAKGTFFITKAELDNNSKELKEILNKGHEIGICLTNNIGTDYESICKYIITMQNELKKQYGISPTLVRYPYVIGVTDEILEAISSTGCTLVWHDLSIASAKVGVNGTLDEVINNIFNAGNITARRGYIMYFRMDYYKDSSLIGNLITNIYENRIKNIAYEDDIYNNGSEYQVITLSELMNSEGVYTYPVKESDYVSGLGGIDFGHLEGFTEEEKYEYILDRYIGTPTINNEITLPGFTKEEIVELDKSGRFTDDKVLFLTFDDWGSDKTINQILYVLKKYDVKANFYVRTNYVDRNPNLLRAIALDGHDIGSHTDEHRPFANTDIFISEDDTTSIYTSLTFDELLLRKNDLSVSYYKLRSIIGDVEVDGSPALTKIFRPPTLAMSKGGMEAILDMGFDYIVSGDFSTHDYEAEDKYELVDKILNGLVRADGSVYKLQNGSVLVMHMSDDSTTPSSEADITAAALDMVIPILLENGYEFGRISDYLN